MITSVASVGDPFRIHCATCGEETKHTASGIQDARVTEARCGNCGAVVVFAPPAARSRTHSIPATGPTRRSAQPVSAVEEQWRTLVAGRGTDAATPCAPDARLTSGELIHHPVFGLGIVRRVLSPQKLEAHFRDGIKKLSLAHAEDGDA